MWQIFLTGFAYFDVGVTILVTYFILPLALAYLGVRYLYQHIKGIKHTGI